MNAFFKVAGWVLLSLVLSVPLFVVWKLCQGFQPRMAEVEWAELQSQWASLASSKPRRLAAPPPPLQAAPAAAPAVSSAAVASAGAVALSSANPVAAADPARVSTAPAAAAVSSSSVAAVAADTQPAAYFQLSSKDPFASPTEVVEVKEVEQARDAPIEDKIELQGIISSGRQNSAIVNNEVRKVGDSVLGAKIVRITDSTVYFKFEDRSFKKIVEGGVIQR